MQKKSVSGKKSVYFKNPYNFGKNPYMQKNPYHKNSVYLQNPYNFGKNPYMQIYGLKSV